MEKPRAHRYYNPTNKRTQITCVRVCACTLYAIVRVNVCAMPFSHSLVRCCSQQSPAKRQINIENYIRHFTMNRLLPFAPCMHSIFHLLSENINAAIISGSNNLFRIFKYNCSRCRQFFGFLFFSFIFFCCNLKITHLMNWTTEFHSNYMRTFMISFNFKYLQAMWI